MRLHLFPPSLRQRLPKLRQHLQRRDNSDLRPKAKSEAVKEATGEVSQKAQHITGSSQASTPPVSAWRRLGPLTSAFDAFGRSQKKRPYTTQIISAMIIFTCADVSAQNIADSDYDPVRTARAILIGGVAAVPQYRWYVATKLTPMAHADNVLLRFHVLARYFNYPSRVLSVGVKVLFNQFTFAVLFPFYFFGSQAILTGETLQGTVERLKQTVPVSWTNSWKVWPAAMAINLSFVPLEYRALFSGFVAVGWQTYLSWMNRQAEIKRATELVSQDGSVTSPSNIPVTDPQEAFAA